MGYGEMGVDQKLKHNFLCTSTSAFKRSQTFRYHNRVENAIERKIVFIFFRKIESKYEVHNGQKWGLELF